MLCRARDAETIAGDVVEMRAAIAAEKGDKERWDLKYVAGGLVDLEFIAQYLQLVHAADKPEILDTATARVLDKAARLGVLARRGCRRAASGGAALSEPDADPAAVPRRAVRSEGRRAAGCSACWRAPPTCRTSPRSKRISPKRRRACARASCGFWGRRRSRRSTLPRRMRLDRRSAFKMSGSRSREANAASETGGFAKVVMQRSLGSAGSANEPQIELPPRISAAR